MKILELGVTKAAPVYQQAGIPFGKIYDVLNSLVKLGMIEIQDSRPKRYMAKHPKFAFERIYEQKKEQMESDLRRTKALIDELLQNIPEAVSEDHDEKFFWSTAVGKKEIADLIRSTFMEAENEICVIPHILIGSVIPDIVCFFMRTYINGEKPGLRVRLLTSRQFNPTDSLPSSIRDHELFTEVIRHYELRMTENIDSHFGVIDSEKVIMLQKHPTEPEQILSVLKIWDREMATSLLGKFNEMWDAAEKVSLNF
jgi:sugar-specific transcriptional regulator TrmB